MRYLRWYLDKVTRGELKKLMVFMPPRHGKTEQGSIRYPAYRLELDPSIRIGLVTHTQKFANRVSRNCRKIVESRIEMNPSKRAAGEWETRAGGGMNAFGALGVGGGLGFNLLIIDDIIKGSKQAHSPTYRENLAESFHRDIKTRLEPGAAIVMTFTRWHKQDIGGMLLDSDEAKEWVVIKLPALAELDDPLGRLPGMALWPERWSAAYLRALQLADPWGFEALYQQNPRLRSGGMFLEEYFGPDAYVDSVPGDCRYVRYWDKSATEGGTGAATAGVLVALSRSGTAYIVDVVRGRWNSGTRETVIDRIAMIDGPMVEVVVEQEPGSGGKESAENTVNRLRSLGFNCSADRVTGDKALRAWPIAAQCAIGNVKIVRDTQARRWNASLVTELVDFPQGALKDQVDALSGAYNRLALVPIPGAVEVSGPRLGIEHNIEKIFHLDGGIIQGGDEPGTIWKPEYEREWSGF